MSSLTRISRPSDLNVLTTDQGILAGTHIRTLDGVLPVEFLCPGDRIITRNGSARLVSVSTSRRKGVAVIRITASSLGHDRPETDLLLAPGQRVVIRDWRARVLYGTDVAAIAASRLADGEFVLTEFRADVRLFTLRFATEEVIYAEGLELACHATEPALTDAT
jgi:hypothetical protein